MFVRIVLLCLYTALSRDKSPVGRCHVFGLSFSPSLPPSLPPSFFPPLHLSLFLGPSPSRHLFLSAGAVHHKIQRTTRSIRYLARFDTDFIEQAVKLNKLVTLDTYRVIN